MDFFIKKVFFGTLWYFVIHPAPSRLKLKKKVVVGVIILLLVVYTFYRLLHVWLHTLNFSEVIAHCSFPQVSLKSKKNI